MRKRKTGGGEDKGRGILDSDIEGVTPRGRVCVTSMYNLGEIGREGQEGQERWEGREEEEGGGCPLRGASIDYICSREDMPTP